MGAGRRGIVKRGKTSGFTLLEMAVTLSLMALTAVAVLAGFGSLTSHDDTGRAQITASAALHAELGLWEDTGAFGIRSGSGAPAALAPPDPDVPAGQPGGGSTDPVVAAELGACTNPSVGPAIFWAPAPVGGTGMYPVGQVTNCPMFSNPHALATSVMSAKLVSGVQVPSSPDGASVAAVRTATGWRLASATPASPETCVMLWRDIPSPAVTADVRTRYFVVEHNSGYDCTAGTALALAAPTSSGPCQTFSTETGTSWDSPCTILVAP